MNNAVLGKKTIDKYYLDSKEITESEFRAIEKFIEHFCNTCCKLMIQKEYPANFSSASKVLPLFL
jgi:hypothetical protein